MYKVFIDGREGTTGLRIYERLASREDVSLITLPEEKRKDAAARREALNSCDIALLCLPDDAARQAVSMVENPAVRIIDASTAHRTAPGWVYGFPELSPSHRAAIADARRLAVPGCHASGFIALVYPLVQAGVIPKDAFLTCHSLTGYSGGGKKMIAQYESAERSPLLSAPRIYGLPQAHKHLPEMQKLCCLEAAPVFFPVVADFYSGMLTTVSLDRAQLHGGASEIRAVYRELYTGPLVCWRDEMDEGGFLSASALSGSDRMDVSVFGSGGRIALCARFDNLGKGASGAALECLNIMTGAPDVAGLTLKGVFE